MSKTMTREQWLAAALHKHVAPLLAKHGATVPADCLVSVGWPGGGSARKRIGECWTRKMSSKGKNEIFISPRIADKPMQMLDVLVHEAIHASDDCASGHKGHFARVARACGLEGKLTATHAGKELAAKLATIIEKLPKLEHSKLDIAGRKVQTTRMVKVTCMDCGYTLRTTQKWLAVGLPTCCCGGEMGAH